MKDILYDEGIRVNLAKKKLSYQYNIIEGAKVQYKPDAMVISNYTNGINGKELKIRLRITPSENARSTGWDEIKFGEMEVESANVNGYLTITFHLKRMLLRFGNSLLVVAEKKHSENNCKFQLKTKPQMTQFAEAYSKYNLIRYWSLTTSLRSYSEFRIGNFKFASIFNHVSTSGAIVIFEQTILFYINNSNEVIIESNPIYTLLYNSKDKKFHFGGTQIPLYLVIPVEYMHDNEYVLPSWKNNQTAILDPFDNHVGLIQQENQEQESLF